MLFNSYVFIFAFLPVVVAGYYLLLNRGFTRSSLIFATLLSLAFYAYWNIKYVPLLVISVVVNFHLGRVLIEGKTRHGNIIAAMGVLLNLAALGYYKYANFFLDQIEQLTRQTFDVKTVIMPLAISFFTFQQIAYIVDARRGRLAKVKFVDYAFIVTFFPHLIAGPIVRFREMAPQFRTDKYRLWCANLAIGFAVFVIGLAKKVLIADYFGSVATPLFDDAATFPSLDIVTAWVAALAYALQLYFDFSGYSDMAIGLSRMFGFRLSVNFLSPYKSTSIAEFWRRWHITLSRFLRDYLYVPLGGNRAGRVRTHVNLVATMALGGLWHGAAWTFVAWGLYHGALLALHRFWRVIAPRSVLEVTDRWRPFWTLITFLLVVFGWVLFRSPDFATATTMLRGMLDIGGLRLSLFDPYPTRDLVAIAAGLLACWTLPNVYQLFFGYRPALILREQISMVRPKPSLLQFRFGYVEAAATSLVLMTCLYAMRSVVSEFLYFMF